MKTLKQLLAIPIVAFLNYSSRFLLKLANSYRTFCIGLFKVIDKWVTKNDLS